MEAIARAPRADVLAAAIIVGALLRSRERPRAASTAAVAPLVLAVILFATWHEHALAVGQPGRADSRDRAVRSDHEVPVARNLPFQIELYRLVVALVVFIWITSLLIDRRVRLERTAFDKPLLLIVLWAASRSPTPVVSSRSAPTSRSR